MIGVLTRYFVKTVLRFDHADFLKAIKMDINPLLGELGVWSLTNYANRQKEKGKTDKRKMALVAVDLVKSFLENGLD